MCWCNPSIRTPCCGAINCRPKEAKTTVNQIVLPWPPKELNPNKRLHWSVKAMAAKNARETAFNFAKYHRLEAPKTEKIAIKWQFYPPDKRKRDDDNMIASTKHYRDGIAYALGIDDNKFITTLEVMSEVVKGGKVVVTLGEVEQ